MWFSSKVNFTCGVMNEIRLNYKVYPQKCILALWSTMTTLEEKTRGDRVVVMWV